MATSWAESISSRSNARPFSSVGFPISGKAWSGLPGSDVAIFEKQAAATVNGLPGGLALLQFDDDREGDGPQRRSPAEPASISESAKAKADTKLTPTEFLT